MSAKRHRQTRGIADSASAEATQATASTDAAAPEVERERLEDPGAAEPDSETSTPAVPAQCLTFQLAGEEYAVDILQVREIVEYDTVTSVPSTPPWILGVMNLRGTVVPVIDLALRFGLGKTEMTPLTCVVMVEADLDGDSTLMGVVVDAVVRVLDLTPDDVEPPPAFGTRVGVEYLLGVGKVDGELVLVLDADRVLSLDELLAVAELPAAVEQDLLPSDASDCPGNATEPAKDSEAAPESGPAADG